jgi:hypothetical protein
VSDAIIVQYLGYEAKLLVREYAFQVREAGAEREFTLNIENEAFLSHKVSYQDAPGICSQRLQAELAAHANHPAETHYVITAAELDAFRASHVQKASRYPSRESKA